MKKVDPALVNAARNYAVKMLENHLPEEYLYHSLAHTRRVLRDAMKIGKAEGLGREEMDLLKIAALFHDVGYIHSGKEHERRSAAYAEEFMKRHDVEEEQAGIVKKAILSTRVPQDPDNRISKVLCDADMAHLASKDYFNLSDLMKKELEITGEDIFSEKEFHERSLEFFRRHHYHTHYGRTALQKGKERNEQLIRKKL